jgi:DNA-directed RNA polymerase specialized sigma24 family protein
VAVEVATEFYPWSGVLWTRRPDSDIEGMMSAMPYCEPDAATPEAQALREALVDCLDQLGDEDRFLVEAIWFERLTVRALAPRLGLEKSQTHRLCCRAVVRLGALCVEHPVLQARYGLQVGLQSYA